MAININADTTNGLVITSDNSGEINFQNAGSTVATLNGTGLTMGAGMTLPASALTGTFPAIDASTSGIYLGGTTAANLLDNYEEGTWTLTVTNSNDDVTATYTRQDGYYRKIGSLVWCYGRVELASYSVTSTGIAVEIGGLPFVVDDILPGSNLDGGGYASYWGNLTTTWGNITAGGLGGSNKIRLFGAKTPVATAAPVLCSDFSSNSNLRVTLIYLTSE